jgi:hypothetical protein
MEGLSVDYAVIHAPKIGISLYPPGACTPPKIDRVPPRGEVATIDVECLCICRWPAREYNFCYKNFIIPTQPKRPNKCNRSHPKKNYILVINTMYPIPKDIDNTGWWI